MRHIRVRWHGDPRGLEVPGKGLIQVEDGTEFDVTEEGWLLLLGDRKSDPRFELVHTFEAPLPNHTITTEPHRRGRARTTEE